MNTQSKLFTAQKLGLTQTQIAYKSGVSQTTIHRLLSGEFVKHEIEAKVWTWLDTHRAIEFGGDVYFLRSAA